MKKILILGAGHYQLPLIKKAIEIGLYTIVVSPAGDYPGLDIADKTYDYDIRDMGNILKIAIMEKIDGVVTDQTDIPVRTAAYIAEKLNLSGIGYKVSRIFTDKLLMRKKCRMAGIGIKKYEIADNIEGAKKFCSKIGFPVVIKPLNNQGSRGVYKIHDTAELNEHFLKAQEYTTGRHDILIEEFISGHEIVSASLVLDGHYQNLVMGDSYNFDLKNKFIPKNRFFETVCENDIKNHVLELDRKIIKTFGLVNGITHGEYIIDDKTKKAYLIEIGARGGGVFISSEIIPLFTNLDTSLFILKNALGEKFKLSIKKKQDIAGGYIAFYIPAGKVIDLDGIDEICSLKNVINHNLYSIKKGQVVNSIEDKSSRKAILIRATDRQDLWSLREKIKSMLNIKIKTGEGIKGVKWE